MSFLVFFEFSSGLADVLKVPKGTLQSIMTHVDHVEATLKVERERYLDNPEHWARTDYSGIADALLCETAETHNAWRRRLYEQFAEWAERPANDGEDLTPEDAKKFWPALVRITVPAERWTADYFRARMESLYEVMRGRESEGVSFDAKALTPKQAAAVIHIFDQYLDPADLRLDVPTGHDYLASSNDGGYDWCDKCFRPMAPDDGAACRRRKCPLRESVA